MSTIWSAILNAARTPLVTLRLAPPVRTIDLPPDLTVPSVVRALRAEGQGIYGLGKGGRRPGDPLPFDREGKLDCSGLLSWVWEESRKDSDDGEDDIDGDWIYTTALFIAAKNKSHGWIEVAPADVQPGDGLVYRGGTPTQKIGHCMLAIARQPKVRTFADVLGIHCHGPSGKGPAVTRATGALFARKPGIAVRRVA